jgi:hypothetical protein
MEKNPTNYLSSLIVIHPQHGVVQAQSTGAGISLSTFYEICFAIIILLTFWSQGRHHFLQRSFSLIPNIILKAQLTLLLGY